MVLSKLTIFFVCVLVLCHHIIILYNKDNVHKFLLIHVPLNTDRAFIAFYRQAVHKKDIATGVGVLHCYSKKLALTRVGKCHSHLLHMELSQRTL